MSTTASAASTPTERSNSAEAAPPQHPATPARRRRPSRTGRRTAVLFLMGLPAVIVLFVFSYVPMAGVVIAFQQYVPTLGILHSHWVGLANFTYLFTGPDAARITRNTIVMNAVFLVVNTTLSLGLAILMNEVKDRFKFLFKLFQTAYFLPFVLSYVVVAAFTLAFLNPDTGVVNGLLHVFGLKSVAWYQTPSAWPVILTIVEAWKRIGFWVIVYLAAIIGFNPEFYEAADIDGATRWQKIRLVTLPLLAPIIIINVLLSVGTIFNADFGLFFQVPQNSTPLYPTTDVIDTYVYRALTSLGSVSMSAAAGLYQSVVGFILVLTANWLVRRRNSDGALF